MVWGTGYGNPSPLNPQGFASLHRGGLNPLILAPENITFDTLNTHNVHEEIHGESPEVPKASTAPAGGQNVPVLQQNQENKDNHALGGSEDAKEEREIRFSAIKTLYNYYSEGPSIPIMPHLVNRLRGLDALAKIDAALTKVDMSAAYMFALRPTFPYSYGYKQRFSNRRLTTSALCYARTGLSSLLTVNKTYTSNSPLKGGSRGWPIFNVGVSPHVAEPHMRTLSPIGLEVFNLATSQFSKTLLTASSKVFTQSLYTPDVLSIFGEVFLPHVMQPVSNYTPILVRALLALIHILGSGSGNCSLSSSIFESSIPQFLTVSHSTNMSNRTRYCLHTWSAYKDMFKNGIPPQSTLPPTLAPEGSSARVLIPAALVTSPMLPWLLMLVSSGPQFFLYSKDVSTNTVDIGSKGKVTSPIPDAAKLDLHRLWNLFRFDGYRHIDVVIVGADRDYVWPHQNGVYVHGGKGPNGTGGYGNTDVHDGIGTIFSSFNNNVDVQTSDLMLGLSTLWNHITTTYATEEEVTMAIKIAAAFALVYPVQPIVYSGCPKVFQSYTSYYQPSSENCYTTDSAEVQSTWDTVELSSQVNNAMVLGMTLPFGQPTVSSAQWFNNIDKADISIFKVGNLPLQNLDYLSLDMMEFYAPTTGQLYDIRSDNLILSAHRTVNLGIGYTALADFFAYLASVPAQSFYHDRMVNSPISKQAYSVYERFIERFIDDFVGWDRCDLFNLDTLLNAKRLGGLAPSPIPWHCSLQRCPLPIIMHYTGLHFGQEHIKVRDVAGVEGLQQVVMRNDQGRILVDALGTAAPSKLAVKLDWSRLSAWYSDTTCAIPLSGRVMEIINYAAIWDPTQEKRVTGFVYTYFSPNFLSSFNASEPIFNTSINLTTPYDDTSQVVIQNLSMPQMLSFDPYYESTFYVISADNEWIPTSGPAWKVPYLENVVKRSGRRLLAELRIASNNGSGDRTFLDDV